MITQINVFSLSQRPVISEGINSLVKPEEGIIFSNHFDNFQSAVKHFINRNKTIKHSDTFFIDDSSFSKPRIINFLHSFHSAYKTKTIIYTDSIDSRYLNELWLSNVSSILHNRETPLADFFRRFKKESKPGQRNSLYGIDTTRYFDTGKKFIDTVRLINRGCDCYDELVTSIILGKHIWAKRESGYNGLSNYWNLFDVRQGYKAGLKSRQHNPMIDASDMSELIKTLHLLSGREIEILLLLSEGKKNSEIAAGLFISADTVVKHKWNMIRKLGLKSTNELFIFAIQNKSLLSSK